MAQPGFRLDAVEFAASDQTEHDFRTVTTTIRAEEHIFMAPQRDHTERVFVQVIVYLHPAIAAVFIQDIPLFQQVRERFRRI